MVTQWCINFPLMALVHFKLYVVFDPRGRPTVPAGSDHCFCTCRLFLRPSVRPSHFSKQNKFQAKTCSLLARLWIWPSGSLMTPVLLLLHLKAILDFPQRIFHAGKKSLLRKNEHFAVGLSLCSSSYSFILAFLKANFRCNYGYWNVKWH